MTISAVVFDLDGLMFDTEALFHRVSSELLAERGRAFTPEIMNAMIGRRPLEAGEQLKRLSGIEESVEEWLSLVRERFGSLVNDAVSPTPGLLRLLDVLRGRAPLAVATSSNRSYARGLLDRHAITDRFEFILAAEDVIRGKPDPEIYATAARRLGVAAGSILVLEDSPAGVESARRAGAVVVAVPHAHSPAHALGPADLIVPALDAPELLDLLERRLGSCSQFSA